MVVLKNRIGRYVGLGVIIILYGLEYYFQVLDEMSMVIPMYGLTTFYIGALLNVTNCFFRRF